MSSIWPFLIINSPQRHDAENNTWVDLWYVDKDKSNDFPNLEIWNLIISMNQKVQHQTALL